MTHTCSPSDPEPRGGRHGHLPLHRQLRGQPKDQRRGARPHRERAVLPGPQHQDPHSHQGNQL